MKKVIILMFSLICSIVLLVGCSSEKTETAVTKPETDAKSNEEKLTGEISFSTWGSAEEKKVNEEIIALFEQKHPGTKVNLEYIPDEYTTKIDTMFLGKNAPDVIYGHPKYFTNWASKGLLMDLTDKFNADPELLDDSKFSTGLYDSFKYKGKNIATVNGADTLVVFYNKDMFDAAGLDYPKAGWTLDDFRDAAQKLTIKDENGKTTQFGATIGGAGYSACESFIFANGGKFFDDMNNPQKAVFNSPETVEALQFIQDLYLDDKSVPSSLDNQNLGGNWDTGKVAMDITGVWAVVYRTAITDFKWDMVEIPTVEGKEAVYPALYAGYAISNTTNNPDLAWEFARFMQSDEAQKMLASSGLITVINKEIASSDEVIKIENAPEHHIIRVTTLDNAVHNDAVLENWEEILSKYFDPNIQLMITGGQSAQEAAEKIQAGFEEALNSK